VLRLQHVVSRLRSGPDDAGLAAPAMASGSADQVHLSRESRRLTGLTPRELARFVRPSRRG
jgi:hypothetical protein